MHTVYSRGLYGGIGTLYEEYPFPQVIFIFLQQMAGNFFWRVHDYILTIFLMLPFSLIAEFNQ